jgi:hypothetical protein
MGIVCRTFYSIIFFIVEQLQNKWVCFSVSIFIVDMHIYSGISVGYFRANHEFQDKSIILEHIPT